MQRIYFLVIACLYLNVLAIAADSTKTVYTKARLLSVDASGNAYTVTNGNLLVKYNEAGDSIGLYNGVLNGEIGAVDAINPLRISLYYPSFSKIILLDRTLNIQSEIDLRRIGISAGALAAPSSDNNIWVYDSYTASLRKIDETGQVMRTSNDLRQQISYVPQVCFLTERERRVYLVDSTRGILVFDQFGTFLNTYPIKGVREVQVVGDDIIYYKNGSLISYNTRSFNEQAIKLSVATNLLSCAISPKHLVLLFSDRLEFQNWNFSSKR